MSRAVLVGLLLCLVVGGGAWATTYDVYPGDSIQAAITGATDGDTIIVHPGAYIEQTNLAGKNLTLRSEDPDDPATVAGTIINGGGSGPVVSIMNGEGPGCVVAGLTITGGAGADGAGVYSDTTSPIIEKSVITGNTASANGGGIFCYGGSPTIRNNLIRGNAAPFRGGGVVVWGGTPTIEGNTIRGNSDPWYGGGGIYALFSEITVRGNVISDNTTTNGQGGGLVLFGGTGSLSGNVITGNSASSGGGISAYFASADIAGNTLSGNTGVSGGGLYCQGATVTLKDTIIAFSSAGDGIYLASGTAPTLSYCNIYGNPGGDYVAMADPTGADGNLSVDPLFANAPGGDVHLKSTGGRWDPVAATWVVDAVHSPCIDAADPAADFSQEPTPNGDRRNMGAYGNTPQASKSLSADQDPPLIALAPPSTAVLWPLNKKLTNVTFRGMVADGGSGLARACLEVVDEYGEFTATYDLMDKLDANGNFQVIIKLMPWRNGGDRDGRTYTITLRAEDELGNVSTPLSVVVVAPHDRR